jgi:hypothetical protein
MGRVYFAENTIQQCIDCIISHQESCIGLVIGQLPPLVSKDFVIHMVATPSPPTDGDESEPSTRQWLALEGIDENYVADHARQVRRMLLGGFDIIGIFACAKPDELKNAQTKLRQVVYAVHKVLSSMDGTVNNRHTHGDRVLMQICPLSRKLSCRTFDVTDLKSTSCPAELKFQKFTDHFCRLQTTFSLDVVVPVPVDSMSFSLSRQILAGLKPVFQSIWNSLATVNDQMLAGSEPLCQKPSEKTKSKQRPDEELDSSPFIVNLLQPMSPLTVPSSCEMIVECGAKMFVRGTIVAKAFVHAKSTVADAIQALKEDIIRSIIARCELLCEDLLQAEEEQDVKILYETPLRVFASMPNNLSIEFCDYLFPDETVSDCVSRFSELLGVDVSNENVNADMEHAPSESDLEKPVKPTRKLRHVHHGDSTPSSLSTKHLYRYVGLAASVAVASLAALMSYWSYSVSDQQY